MSVGCWTSVIPHVGQQSWKLYLFQSACLQDNVPNKRSGASGWRSVGVHSTTNNMSGGLICCFARVILLPLGSSCISINGVTRHSYEFLAPSIVCVHDSLQAPSRFVCTVTLFAHPRLLVYSYVYPGRREPVFATWCFPSVLCCQLCAPLLM